MVWPTVANTMRLSSSHRGWSDKWRLLKVKSVILLHRRGLRNRHRNRGPEPELPNLPVTRDQALLIFRQDDIESMPFQL